MFKSELKDQQSNFGGGIKAPKKAEEWFDEQKKGSSRSKNVIKWTKKLHPGKLYTFKYNPLYKEELWYFDKEPLVIIISETNTSNLFLGINLNYLPKKIKWQIVSKIRDNLNYEDRIKSKPFNAQAQKPVLIPDTLLRQFKKFGLQFAIRSYYLNRIKDCYCFCYEDWSKGLLLNTLDIYGITEKHVEKLFYQNLKNVK